MNREIEFRAWLEKEKKMVKAEEINFTHKEVRFKDSETPFTKPIEINVSFEDIELMQYTGLKDKNGVKIFEGDIILNFEEEIAVVVWNNAYGQFELDYGNYQVTFEHSCVSRYKVIGNIYENKELLNE